MFGGGCKSGRKVIIVEDCRENPLQGERATGQVGTLLGEKPRSVLLFIEGNMTEWIVDYNEYLEGIAIDYVTEDGEKHTDLVNEVFPLVDEHTDRRTDDYAEVITNACIQLPSGDLIWGDECWWKLYDPHETLEALKEELKKFKLSIMVYLSAYGDEDYVPDAGRVD